MVNYVYLVMEDNSQNIHITYFQVNTGVNSPYYFKEFSSIKFPHFFVTDTFDSAYITGAS